MDGVELNGFAIRNPPDTVLPSTFLLDNVDEILSHMRDSELLKNREHDTFRLWIWANTHFVRVAHHNLNPDDDLYSCKKHNTQNYYVPGFNGGLRKETLLAAIADLHSLVERAREDMAGSGWGFQYASHIKICVGKIDGRVVGKTVGTKKIINHYIKYFVGWRGVRDVINFNYCNESFRNLPDVCTDWNGKSPCVMYAMKAYKMLQNDQLPNREKILKNLLAHQTFYKYEQETLDAIRATRVEFPSHIFSEGIELKDFAVLERVNKIPIAVYHIRGPEDRDAKDRDNDVTITCLRAPKPSVIREYGGLSKVLYLALIDADHVILIPDIFKYMKSIFNRNESEKVVRGPPLLDRRCPFCFGVLISRDVMIDHVHSGVCNSYSTQPARIIMPRAGTLISHEIQGATDPPLLMVVIDTESKLLPPDNVSTEDFVFDGADPEDPTVTVHEGVLHYHVPQSVGMCFLDHEMEVLGYHKILDDEAQYIFPAG